MRSNLNLKKRIQTKYGSWALVTGASSGIGKAIATQLAECGLNLILSARNEKALGELSESLETNYTITALVVIADLNQPIEIEKLIKSTEEIPLGLFVAAAGFGTSGLFQNATIDTEIRMLNVNAFALMTLTHYFAHRFASKQKGGIILMGSIVGFQGTPYAANYAATKAYVQTLGEALYHELKPFGVDILVAAPGPVDSGFAAIANMDLGNAQNPQEVVLPILKALGKKHTVFPGKLTKILIFGLRTVPRWGKIRIMKQVMGKMTKPQYL